MNYKKILETKKFLLLNEYKNLKNEYIKFAKFLEKEKNNFNNKHILKDNKTGQLHTLKFSLKFYLKEYFNTIIQRLIYNKVEARKDNLIPFFITFTLPSNFHPFRTYNRTIDNWELNENFSFNSIQEAIEKGYTEFQLIFRYFYTYIKTQNRKYRELAKKMRYNGFFEYHKSFIPHFHLLIYIPQDLKDFIYQAYEKTLLKFNLQPQSNQIIEIQAPEPEDEENNLDRLDGAVLYISKYISKNLKDIMDIPDDLDDLQDFLDKDIFENFKIKENNLYLYIGWKAYNNIRIFRGNNTKIGIKNYKKIYYSLTEEEKKELLEKAQNNKTCLLYEIEQLSTRMVKILNTGKKKITKNKFKFKIIEKKEKEKKTRYTKIFELFEIYEIFEYLHNKHFNKIDFMINNFETYFNFLDYDKNLENDLIASYKTAEIYTKLINFMKDIKKFYNYFKLVITRRFKNLIKQTDLPFNQFVKVFKNKINNELNTHKTQLLDNLIKQFEGKEKKFKLFLKFLSKLLKISKPSYNDLIYQKVLDKFNNYLDRFKKWVNSDLSFASLFFTTQYKTISHKIYTLKNSVIYDNKRFSLLILQ